MNKGAFMSAIFIVLFWCAFLCAAVGAAVDVSGFHSVASLLWRVSGIAVLVDGVLLWICK